MSTTDQFGLVDFVRGLGGIAQGVVSYPLFAIPRTVRHIFSGAMIDVWRAIWRMKRVGPNLKTVLTVVSVPAAALTPGVVGLIAGLYGVYRGFKIACDEKDEGNSLLSVFPEAYRELRTLDRKEIAKMLEDLATYKSEPLDPGTKPFDISPLKAIRGLAAGSLSAVAGATLIGTLVLFRLPQLSVKGFKIAWEDEDQIFLGLLYTIGVIIITLILIPLSFLIPTLFELVDGTRHGYQESIGFALGKAWDTTKKVSEAIKDFLGKKKQPTIASSRAPNTYSSST